MRWKWSASVAAIAILGVIAAALIAWGFPSTPDGAIHARWTHHFATQFWEGDPYPRWLVGTNYGFGSATFWYYPPFGVWMASLFNPVAPTPWHALGWSTAMALVASAFTSHLLFRRRVSAKAAMVAAFCYAVAPYGISCLLFAQGAYAQFWALAWMPLVLYAIDRTPRMSIGGIGMLSIALALLFTTHVLTAIVFAPLAVCYALFLGRKPMISLCLAFLVALGLTAVYWLPIPWVEARIVGGTQELFQGEMLERSLFFQGGALQEAKPFGRDSFLVSYLLLFFIYYLACWWGVIERKRSGWSGWMLMGLGGFYLLMQTPLAMPVYEAVPPLRRIQFVWRFMSPATVVATLMIGLLLHGWRRQGSSARMMAGMASGLWLACAIGLVGFELSGGVWPHEEVVVRDRTAGNRLCGSRCGRRIHPATGRPGGSQKIL